LPVGQPGAMGPTELSEASAKFGTCGPREASTRDPDSPRAWHLRVREAPGEVEVLDFENDTTRLIDQKRVVGALVPLRSRKLTVERG
jgi:hypothetical protein